MAAKNSQVATISVSPRVKEIKVRFTLIEQEEAVELRVNGVTVMAFSISEDEDNKIVFQRHDIEGDEMDDPADAIDTVVALDGSNEILEV